MCIRDSSCTFCGSRNEGMGTAPASGISSRRKSLTSMGAMAVVAAGSTGGCDAEASTESCDTGAVGGLSLIHI